MKNVYQTFICGLSALLLTFGSIAQNNAIDCAGGDYAAAPSGSSLIVGSSQISMTMRVFTRNNGAEPLSYEGYAGLRNNVDADFYVLLLPNLNIEARFRNSTGTEYTIVSPGFVVDVWQQYTMTYDGAQLKFFVNGVMTGSTPASGTITNDLTPFEIGRAAWGLDGFYTNGRLDEITLWSKALTDAEVLDIYNQCSIDASSEGLQLYYDCNQGVAGGNNVGITTLTDVLGNLDADFVNFAMTGETSNFQTGAAGSSSTLNDFYCSGTPYQFGDQVIDAAGTYTATFTSASGCDSTVVLTLYDALDPTILEVQDGLACVQSGATYQWVDCDNGNAPIPGATELAFYPDQTGNYACLITNSGCTSLSACNTVVIVGTASPLIAGSIKVSPSPANTFVILSDAYQAGAARTYQLCNLQGQVIHQGQVTATAQQIPVADLADGMYLLRVTERGTTLQTCKVAIAR